MTAKKHPLYRVSFCAPTTDGDGNPKLSNAVEIGAVWARSGDKQGAIMRLNLVPTNLADGVIFLMPPRGQSPEPR
ncbi:MAG: hypothetical protein J0I57_17305 [Hyphomicrobium sp.]|nr:hypothetical protein [Hyphomicrobium sp.]MBN9279370.1 hypothetical protein [Hyphomicrobium sp.]OJU28798.1 MAG: hypothetical protein BGN89_07765 [Alphaproteobacteria bacterium 64-6]